MQPLYRSQAPLSYPLYDYLFLNEAISSRNFTQARIIITSYPEHHFIDETNQTWFQRIVNKKDDEAFKALADLIDLEKNRFIHTYIAEHGTLFMLQYFLLNLSKHADRLYKAVVKINDEEKLLWLIQNVSICYLDLPAFEMACSMPDTKFAFLLLDYFTKVLTSGYYNASISLYNAVKANSLVLAKAILNKIDDDYCCQRINNHTDKSPCIAAVETRNSLLINAFVDVFKEEFLKACDKKRQSALEHLYKQNNRDIIFEILTRFPKFKDEYVTRKLFIKAIELDDLLMVSWLCDYGVELNQSCMDDIPLNYAIRSESTRILSLFLIKKIQLWGKTIWGENRPHENCLELAVRVKNTFFIRKFLEVTPPCAYDYAFEVKSALKSNEEILSLLIPLNLIHEFKLNTEEIKDILKCLLQIKAAVPNDHLIFLYHFATKTFKTSAEWNLFKENILFFYSQLSLIFRKKILKEISEQLFEYIFLRFNPLLARLPEVFSLIIVDLKNLSESQLKYYFIALQTYDHEVYGDFSIIRRAVEHISKETPTKREFYALTLSEQKGWLEFGAIFRSRKTMNLNITVVKTIRDVELLQLALKGLRGIGIAKLNKSGLFTLSRKLEVLFFSQNDKVRSEAIKTFWSLDKNPNNAIKRGLLIYILKHGGIGPYARQALIETLSNYHHAPEFEFVQILLNLLAKTKSRDLHESIAIALSKIPQLEGLLKAYGTVNSSVWKPYEKFDACHHELIWDEPLIFYHLPKERLLNRSAMFERILDRLADLNYHNPSFQNKIDAHLKFFQNNPDYNPSLKKFSEQYSKNNFRSIGAPLFLPPDTSIVRVLGSTNGSKPLYKKAFVDFLLKGSGSCDLSGEEIEVKEVSWAKNGAAFTTTDPSLYEGNFNNYFSKKDSMMIMISAEEYNRHVFLGEGRMEKERTLNPVFINGFNTSIVEKLFIHEKYKGDLDLLMNVEQASEQQLFSTSIFKNLSPKECVQMRRHLVQTSEHKEKKTSLFDRIAYYNVEKDLSKEELEKNHRFASEEEIYAYSLRRLVARHLAKEMFF